MFNMKQLLNFYRRISSNQADPAVPCPAGLGQDAKPSWTLAKLRGLLCQLLSRFRVRRNQQMIKVVELELSRARAGLLIHGTRQRCSSFKLHPTSSTLCFAHGGTSGLYQKFSMHVLHSILADFFSIQSCVGLTRVEHGQQHLHLPLRVGSHQMLL
jgi:hypothetical protein